MVSAFKVAFSTDGMGRGNNVAMYANHRIVRGEIIRQELLWSNKFVINCVSDFYLCDLYKKNEKTLCVIENRTNKNISESEI